MQYENEKVVITEDGTLYGKPSLHISKFALLADNWRQREDAKRARELFPEKDIRIPDPIYSSSYPRVSFETLSKTLERARKTMTLTRVSVPKVEYSGGCDCHPSAPEYLEEKEEVLIFMSPDIPREWYGKKYPRMDRLCVTNESGSEGYEVSMNTSTYPSRINTYCVEYYKIDDPYFIELAKKLDREENEKWERIREQRQLEERERLSKLF